MISRKISRDPRGIREEEEEEHGEDETGWWKMAKDYAPIVRLDVRVNSSSYRGRVCSEEIAGCASKRISDR